MAPQPRQGGATPQPFDLTDEGRSLVPVLQALYDCGAERAGDTFTPSPG